MKVKCLIVEDEPKALSLLQEYVEQVNYLELMHTSLDAIDAINYANSKEVDLVFLDINLPDLSGIEVAALLKDKAKIIFTTAYSEYAVESYEQNATDYLLKPITFNRFLKAVQKAMNALKEEKKNKVKKKEVFRDTFLVKSGKKIIQLRWSDIYYIEGMKEYVRIFSAGNTTMVYKRMKEIEILHPSTFFRVHNSFIINSDFIKKIENNHIHILDKTIPLGRKYRDRFLKELQDKML